MLYLYLKFTWLLSLLLDYLPEREASPSVSSCVNSSDLLVWIQCCPIRLEIISWFKLTVGQCHIIKMSELLKELGCLQFA